MSHRPQLSWAWLAGFFDGDGCVTLSIYARSTWVSYHLYVGFAQKDRTLLDWIQDYVGCPGTISRGGGAGPGYAWTIKFCQTAEVVRILESLLPHLIVKRDQAAIALEAARLRMAKQQSGRVRYTSEEHDHLQQLAQAMTVAKSCSVNHPVSISANRLPHQPVLFQAG